MPERTLKHRSRSPHGRAASIPRSDKGGLGRYLLRESVLSEPDTLYLGNGFCRAYHRPPVFDPRKCSFFRNRLWLRQAPVSPSRRIQNLESLLKTAFGAGHGVWGKYRNARRDWSREVALPSFGRNTRVGEMCQLLGTDIGIAGVIP